MVSPVEYRFVTMTDPNDLDGDTMDDETGLITRLTDLEIRVAQQDQTIEDLSEIVRKQWDEMDQMRRNLDRQVAQLQDFVADQGNTPPADQPPPHY